MNDLRYMERAEGYFTLKSHPLGHGKLLATSGGAATVYLDDVSYTATTRALGSTFRSQQTASFTITGSYAERDQVLAFLAEQAGKKAKLVKVAPEYRVDAWDMDVIGTYNGYTTRWSSTIDGIDVDWGTLRELRAIIGHLSQVAAEATA